MDGVTATWLNKWIWPKWGVLENRAEYLCKELLPGTLYFHILSSVSCGTWNRSPGFHPLNEKGVSSEHEFAPISPYSSDYSFLYAFFSSHVIPLLPCLSVVHSREDHERKGQFDQEWRSFESVIRIFGRTDIQGDQGRSWVGRQIWVQRIEARHSWGCGTAGGGRSGDLMKWF